MKAIFPSTIDGDLLKLVHLSNGFKMIPGSRPLKAGEVCRAATQVVAVVNGDSSGLVRVGRREQTAIGRLCLRRLRARRKPRESRRSSWCVNGT